MIQHPEVLSFVLCDTVLHCAVTGKHFIQGVYNGFTIPCIPFTIPVPLTMYLAVTDGQGKINFTLKIVDDDDDMVLAETSKIAEFPDPLAVGEMVVALGALTFPHEGVYRFELWAEDECLKTRRIRTKLWKQYENGEESDSSE